MWPAGARELVTGAVTAHLATADAAGEPHVVPICFVLAGESLYFVVDDKPKKSRRGLKRLRNIAANPRVAVVVDRYDDDWTKLAYALMHGEAALVEETAEYARVLVALRDKYSQYRPMPLVQETHAMVRVRIARVHFWQSARIG